MNTITEGHPPLPLAYLLEKIRCFDSMAIEDKRTFLSELVMVHPLLSVDYSKGSIFKRVREWDEEGSMDSFQDLLWNPFSISLGRANAKDSKILYVADRIETALREVVDSESFLLLSELQIRDGASCRLYPIGELLNIQRTGYGRIVGGSARKINEFINACTKKEAQSLLITDSFLMNCFQKDSGGYQISSYIAKCIFEKNSNIDAIVYPSVKQYGGLNLAINVDRFWDSWTIVGARKIKVDYLVEGFYDIIDMGHVIHIDKNGGLSWRMEKYAESGSFRLPLGISDREMTSNHVSSRWWFY